jgi:hypothetical protein
MQRIKIYGKNTYILRTAAGNSLHRTVWNLNTKLILFHKIQLPDHIIHIIDKHNINIHTRIPYHKNSATYLHKQNINHIINICFKRQTTIPHNINILTVSHNNIFSKSLLHKHHPLQIFLTYLKTNDLTLIPADKTPHLGIMRKEVIKTMINLHLSDDTTYQAIPQNRLKAINRVLNKAMSTIPQITKNNFKIPTNTIDRTFKLLIKLQKPNNEWISFPYIPKSRPIVNDTNSITKAASKTILPYLQKIENNSKYTCTSSLQIINIIQELNGNQLDYSTYTLSTGDLENMYTNIDTDTILQILSTPHYQLPNKPIFLNLLRHILKYTTFIALNKIYLQKRGLPMGSCLSGTLANIFLDAFERRIIPKYEHNTTYQRYIDDILIISQNQHTPDNIFNEISNATNLKITHTSSNKQVSFLDLYISKDINGSFNISTYFKFASPIQRPYLKNRRKETQVIVSQILRVWRSNNHIPTFSQQITQIKKYLTSQQASIQSIQAIDHFLAPIKLNSSTPNLTIYNTNHTLCQQCTSASHKWSIKIKKIDKTNNDNNKIIASRRPSTCTMISNTILCKRKLTNIWFISQENSIHNTIELYTSTISNITPIGNLTQKQLFQFSTKFPEILNTTAQTKLQVDEEYPIHVYPILNNPQQCYGLPTTNRRERFLKNRNTI